MTGRLFNLSICWSLLIPAPWEASSRARRRADHGVAVNRAVDRIKIRRVLSEDRGDDAADPPAWKSNIGRHAIDAENFPHSDPLLVLGIANTQGPRAAKFRKVRPFLVILAGVRRSVAGTVAYEAMIYVVLLRERNQWALARRRVGVGVPSTSTSTRARRV